MEAIIYRASTTENTQLISERRDIQRENYKNEGRRRKEKR
jgi:hypothetical protein